MYTEIHALMAALSRAGVLTETSVSTALIAFAQALEDPDFGAEILCELALELVKAGQFERAEEAARLIKGQEKSDCLRRVAEGEARQGQPERAMTLFQDACQAAFIYEFPTQQAQNVAEVGRSLEGVDKKAAIRTWKEAVQIAIPAQAAAGTDGPEASGVIFEAVEALIRLGETENARKTANLISMVPLRERALTACK
jgi:hypothetical protein